MAESPKVLATWKKYLKKKAAQGISSGEHVSFQQVSEIHEFLRGVEGCPKEIPTPGNRTKLVKVGS